MVDLTGIEPATSSMPWNVENLMLTAKASTVVSERTSEARCCRARIELFPMTSPWANAYGTKEFIGSCWSGLKGALWDF